MTSFYLHDIWGRLHAPWFGFGRVTVFGTEYRENSKKSYRGNKSVIRDSFLNYKKLSGENVLRNFRIP